MYDHERSLVKRLADEKFALIGINTDKDLATFEKAVKDNNLPWRSFFDGRSGKITGQYGIRSFPTIFVLDGEGKIRYCNVRGEEMDVAVDKLLAELD